MNWLFLHQNFPGQYIHIARHLADAGDNVVFITQQRATDIAGTRDIPGVRKIAYPPAQQGSPVHPYLHDVEAAVINGSAVAGLCQGLKREGFVPDLIVGHNGWGEILYVKDVWPTIPLLGYFEFFYRATGSDLDFDPEFRPHPEDPMRLRTRNAVNLLGLDAADWGQTPTQWQRDQYPERYHARISVIHEGIDTDRVRPDSTAGLWLRGGPSFSRDQEVITYSARNLEPYRGFHIFMRALPEVLRRRPNAQVLIVGGDGVSYGRMPAEAANWRQQMLAELDGSLDLRRVHFLGRLPYQQYLAVLQLSSVHVYLTYPFVLSWSLLEAMSAGCLVVGSRTPPVEEVIEDGVNGYLVDFFDLDGLADTIQSALGAGRRDHNHPIGASARAAVVRGYDLKSICLPAHLDLLTQMSSSNLHRDRRRQKAMRPRANA